MPIFVTVETGRALLGTNIKTNIEHRTSNDEVRRGLQPQGQQGQQGQQGRGKMNDEGRRGTADGRDAHPPLTAASEKQPGASHIELRGLTGKDLKAALPSLAKLFEDLDFDKPDSLDNVMTLVLSAPELMDELLGRASGLGRAGVENLPLQDYAALHKRFMAGEDVMGALVDFFGSWVRLVKQARSHLPGSTD